MPFLGGNQRDLAREKAQKKQSGKAQASAEMAGNKGLTLEQRRARYIKVSYVLHMWQTMQICEFRAASLRP